MKYIYLIALVGSTSLVGAQTFLNGSFENSTATSCMTNIDNATFNSYFTNVRGIGELQTLDVFYDNACTIYGLAQDGHYFSSIENTVSSVTSTAMSFELSSNMISGNTYSFCFYFKGLYDEIQMGPIEIGISNNSSTFGTLIYTTPTAALEWTNQTVNFQAPITGNYITVRYQNSTAYNGVLIDNFRICDGLGVDNSKASKASYRIYPNPTSDILNIEALENQSDIISLKVYNQIGQKVYDSEYIKKLSVASLPTGIYMLEISTDETAFVYKFVKQ
ncbi:MAG TPA: T9SS type A sorting domain-containing protein [Flavobacterium sp.]|jgi:hypothetical protein